jgi:transglutaminase superfamily protein
VAVETQELEAIGTDQTEEGIPVPVAIGDDGPPPRPPVVRLALVAACPTLAAAMMTGGLFVGAGGRIWAAISGLLGILLAVRTRTIRRPAVLYAAIIGGVFAIGLIAVVPTGFGNIFDLGAEIRRAVSQSDLLRPPVEFQPGWHAVIGWIMGAVGFTAAWLAVEVGRPAFGILVTLPVVGLGAISLPESQQLASGLVALVLFVLSLGILSGVQEDEAASLGLAFELRRALRALPLVALITILLYFASRSNFLFPPPIYDPAQEAKKPKTIPLSEVEDRVLFTADAKFSGPWKMGSLDVYDARDGSWRLPPFADSELNEVPESGIVNERLTPAARATFTIRGLGGAILPGLVNTVGIVAIGPTLSYDERSDNIRVSQGQIEPGFKYIVAAAQIPSLNQLNRASADYPDELKQFLEIPGPPPAVAALLQQAPKDRLYDRLDFLKSKLLHSVTATGAGTPIDVKPDRVQDMLAGSKEGTPFEIVAAEAMLARWAGIPSRIGYGFDKGDPGPGGTFEVRPRHGALFLEVYFNDFGWQPVIGDPLQAKENLTDAPQQFNQQVQVSKDVAVRLFVPILTESKPSFIDEVRRFAIRLGPIVGGLLLIYLLWPLPYKGLRRARRRTWASEEGPEARVALAYAEWRDHATDFGYRHQTDTPLMFLREVVPDDEHAELAWLTTRALWGDLRNNVSADDALAAEELSRSLRRRLSSAHPATMRFVASLSRLSVRHPYAPGLDAAARAEGERKPVAAA